MWLNFWRKLVNADAVYTQRFNLEENQKWLRTIAMIFSHSGDSWFWVLGLGIVWWRGSEEWKKIAATMLLGIALTAIIVAVLKYSIRRQRPAGDWGNIYRKTDPHSFPSGHAARAAMLALIGIILAPPWTAVLLLIWAPLVAISRIAMGVHYLSDVAVGAILGIATGLGTMLLIPLLSSHV